MYVYVRPFDFCPLDLVRAHRMQMVIDALTVLRGAVVNIDRPLATDGLGSFEAWERLVRQAVIWVGALERTVNGASAVGFGDPIANIQAQFAEDDDTEGLIALLEVWLNSQDGEGFTARQLSQELDEARRASPAATVLEHALLDVMPKATGARSVASWLKGVKGRVVRGLRKEFPLKSCNSRTQPFQGCPATSTMEPGARWQSLAYLPSIPQ